MTRLNRTHSQRQFACERLETERPGSDMKVEENLECVVDACFQKGK